MAEARSNPGFRNPSLRVLHVRQRGPAIIKLRLGILEKRLCGLKNPLGRVKMSPRPAVPGKTPSRCCRAIFWCGPAETKGRSKLQRFAPVHLRSPDRSPAGYIPALIEPTRSVVPPSHSRGARSVWETGRCHEHHFPPRQTWTSGRYIARSIPACSSDFFAASQAIRPLRIGSPRQYRSVREACRNALDQALESASWTRSNQYTAPRPWPSPASRTFCYCAVECQ